MNEELSRSVRVSAERLERWVEGFQLRHGGVSAHLLDESVVLTGDDGALAQISVPWGHVDEHTTTPVSDLIALVTAPVRFGALLVRKQAHAVGVFARDELVASKVGSHYVQGRTKAGGWSQQRYARRRDNQTARAYEDAADDAAAVLLPEVERLDALVCGGDTTAVNSVLADPRLAPLAELRAHSPQQVWPVPDPKLAVLRDFPRQFRTLTIRLNELA